jgi:outer membrane PBP1 activator LpoA protein
MNERIVSLIVIGVFLLAGCSSSPVTRPVEPVDRAADADAALESGDFERARSLYQALLPGAVGTEQQRLRLGLARAQLELGDSGAALATIDSISGVLTPALDAERSSVLANVFFDMGRTTDAVRLLVEREIWLESAEAIAANQAQLWDGLSQPVSMLAQNERTGDATIDGWLALIPMTRLAGDDSEFIEALIDWRADFPGHPAAAGILAERVSALRRPGARPARIALLLPLTSERRVEAEAVLDGFFAAHFASGQPEDTQILVYDTAQRGSVESFLTAQISGADFIVGPLLPDEVQRVQTQAGFVPTLALNLGAEGAAVTPNFYQFALSSDDEIEAIAAQAIADGHRTAVTMFASNDRGYVIGERFRQAFESRGGNVVRSVAYVRDSNNLVAPVKDVLNISQSEARYERLAANLGMALEFEPRRRADIDMVFVQADPAIGRLLIPLLRNNGADPEEDVTAYAMSQIYDPARRTADDDLDGLIFPDLPMLIEPDGDAAEATRALSEFSTDSADQQRRLFAFGYDAYRLISALAGAPGNDWPLPGTTGKLSVDSNGRIRRQLPFARFRDGRPEPLTTSVGLTSRQ